MKETFIKSFVYVRRRKMNINDLCINCFKPSGGQEVCMHCGFVQYTKPRQVCHLYPHVVLNNKYIVGKVINNGGFGVVYKAYDTSIRQVVAIKELLPTQNSMVTRIPGTTQVIPVSPDEAGAFENLKQRFLYEANILAQLTCDNIVRVQDFFEANNTAYIVMEYLDGITLKNYIDEMVKGPLSVEQATQIMLPIMNAIKHIHEKNVIHNDISPDNIIVTKTNTVKLIDFGTAKFGDQVSETTNNVIKPGFSPAEQYKSSGDIGEFTDIYGIGALWYYLIAGQAPLEAIDRVEKDTIIKPSKINPEVPSYLDKSIMKAMAVREGARFKNMDDFILAVQGKKKAEFPEVELRKKKIKRAISFCLVIVMLISSVFAAYTIANRNTISPTKDTTITVWVIKDDDEQAQKEYWDDLNENFKDKKNNGTKKELNFEIVYKDAEAYQKDLEDAKKNGTMPTLYVSQYYDTSVINSKDATYSDANPSINIDDSYSEDMESLYNHIKKNLQSENKDKDAPELAENDYNKVKEALEPSNEFALVYDIPVIYHNTKNDKNYKEPSAEELIQNSAINPRAIDALTKAYPNISKDEIKKASSENSLKDFKDGKKVKYYIGFVSDYTSISPDVLNSDYFDMYLLPNAKELEYVIPEAWSIDKKASTNEKNTAKLLLSFMLTNADESKRISLNKTFTDGANSTSLYVKLAKTNLLGEKDKSKLPININSQQDTNKNETNNKTEETTKK